MIWVRLAVIRSLRLRWFEDMSMRRELICITCPLGCHLVAESSTEEGGDFKVTGNRCMRGAHYAHEEILNPRRVVTTTIQALLPDGSAPGPAARAPRRIPVRTSSAFPKEKIPDLLTLLRDTALRLPVSRGTVVMPHVLDTTIDVVVTRTIEP